MLIIINSQKYQFGQQYSFLLQPQPYEQRRQDNCKVDFSGYECDDIDLNINLLSLAIQMGGTTHSMPNIRWSFLKSGDKFNIYHNENGDLAEKHLIANNPKLNEEQEQAAYYYRYTTNKPIVKAYKADYMPSEEFCSNNKNIEVYTEYIPFRLAETRSLSHEQGLYVLSESLIGFFELYKKLGAFPVDDSLIGFNKDGETRVWHSPNFAKNHFDSDNVVLMSTANPHNFDERLILKQEEEMVEDIWNAVDIHANFTEDFRSNIGLMEHFNFHTLKEVVDQYITNAQFVPARLRFEDRNGVISESRRNLENSRQSNRLSQSQRSLMINRRG